jgi:hypothetical protein
LRRPFGKRVKLDGIERARCQGLSSEKARTDGVTKTGPLWSPIQTVFVLEVVEVGQVVELNGIEPSTS